MYKPNDPLNCSRPLLFKNLTTPEFPLTLGASCFLVSYKGKLFIVTALHAMENPGRTLDEVQVNKHLGSGMTLDEGRFLHPLGYWTAPEFDMAVILTNNDPAEIIAEEHLSILQLHRPPLVANPGSLLVFRGYPREVWMNNIEDEEQILSHQAFITDAECVSPDAARPGYHKLRFIRLNEAPISTLNDMSGSPVFQYSGSGRRGDLIHDFAGVLVEGSAESFRGHFVDGYCLWYLLHRIERHL